MGGGGGWGALSILRVKGHNSIKDLSLITGRGVGLQNGRGIGASEVLTYKKGGIRKCFSHAEGGTKSFEEVLAVVY